MEKPIITVIMSVYNDSRYLDESIKSILNQSISNFEFFITDDCSTDNSLEILKKYEKIDKRITIFTHNKNLGLPRSLNEMVQKASGKYIARMDSDDIAYRDRLEKELAILKKNNLVDFVFSNTMLMTRDGKQLCISWTPKNINVILKRLSSHNYIPHPTVMVKRKILLENKYNEKFMRAQDTELWIRLVNKNIKFYFLNIPLLDYRLNPRKMDSNYFYCNTCLMNKDKKNAIKYFSKINSSKDKIKLFIKFFIPHFILRIHGLTKKYI